MAAIPQGISHWWYWAADRTWVPFSEKQNATIEQASNRHLDRVQLDRSGRWHVEFNFESSGLPYQIRGKEVTEVRRLRVPRNHIDYPALCTLRPIRLKDLVEMDDAFGGVQKRLTPQERRQNAVNPQLQMRAMRRVIHERLAGVKPAPDKEWIVLATTDEEEKAEVEALFRQFDENGDGTMSVEELSNLMKNLDGARFTAERVAQLFRSVDKNDDGQIDISEFLAWIWYRGDITFHGQQEILNNYEYEAENRPSTSPAALSCQKEPRRRHSIPVAVTQSPGAVVAGRRAGRLAMQSSDTKLEIKPKVAEERRSPATRRRASVVTDPMITGF